MSLFKSPLMTRTIRSLESNVCVIIRSKTRISLNFRLNNVNINFQTQSRCFFYFGRMWKKHQNACSWEDEGGRRGNGYLSYVGQFRFLNHGRGKQRAEDEKIQRSQLNNVGDKFITLFEHPGKKKPDESLNNLPLPLTTTTSPGVSPRNYIHCSLPMVSL